MAETLKPKYPAVRPERREELYGGLDPARIGPIIEALRQAWERQPGFRLGQLIVNLVPARPDGRSDPFHITDEDLMRRISHFATTGEILP